MDPKESSKDLIPWEHKTKGQEQNVPEVKLTYQARCPILSDFTRDGSWSYVKHQRPTGWAACLPPAHQWELPSSVSIKL